MKILVVDDEKLLVKGIKFNLENDGYEVVTGADGMDAVELAAAGDIDLIVLDLMMPRMDGLEACTKIREFSDVPIIMVTSRTGETDEVLSMSYGADDYITKPYNPTILLLRIAAILKRADSGKNIANYKDAQVNFSKGTISRNGQELVLTKNEMIIFQMLLNNRNRIVSRDELMTDLWDNNEFVNDNALTVNISRLRGKLTEIGYENAIETRKKQGYCLT